MKFEKGGTIEHIGGWIEQENDHEMVTQRNDRRSGYKIGYVDCEKKLTLEGPDGERFEIHNCFIEQNVQMYPIVGGNGEPIIDPMSELIDSREDEEVK